MTSMPVWLKGRNCVASITPLIRDTAGNLFVATGVFSLQGQLEEIDVDSEVQHDEFSPMDIRTAHSEIILDDFAFTLVEVLKTNDSDILAAFSSGYDYCFLQVCKGSKTWGAYLTRGNYNEGLRKGKNTGRLAVRRINVIGDSAVKYYATPSVPAPGMTLDQLLAA